MDAELGMRIILEKIKADNDGVYLDFIVPGYASKRLVAYQSMRYDLILCRDAINTLIQENPNQLIKSSLWHTTVILYGKCYTQPTESGYPKLEADEIFNGDNATFKEVHDKIIELRHHWVAHRGSTDHEMGAAYLKLHPQTLERQVKVQQLKRNGPGEEFLNSCLELINLIIGVVESKFEQSATKAWDHLVKEYTPEQLAMLKIAGPVVENLNHKPE